MQSEPRKIGEYTDMLGNLILTEGPEKYLATDNPVNLEEWL